MLVTRMLRLVLFAIANPSVVCLSSRGPYSGVEIFGNISSPFCIPQPSFDLCAKFYGDRFRGNTPPGALNARGVAK